MQVQKTDNTSFKQALNSDLVLSLTTGLPINGIKPRDIEKVLNKTGEKMSATALYYSQVITSGNINKRYPIIANATENIVKAYKKGGQDLQQKVAKEIESLGEKVNIEI